MIQKTSACAKVILFGEHAVVYGVPAIAIPLSSLRAYATIESDVDKFSIIARNLKNRDIMLDANIDDADNPLTKIVTLVAKHFDCDLPSARIILTSDIPIASGLGSGAAVSTALGRALSVMLNRAISDDELNSLVYEVEKIHHGTPSGIDNTVIVYEKPIYFVKNQEIQHLNINTVFHIIVADTGQTALTHEAVGDVKKLYDTKPQFVKELLSQIEHIVNNAMDCISTGEHVRLGQLMIDNHKLLQQLTVSSPHLDNLVDTAIHAGALGAKLSGGGRGGNMIALVEEKRIEPIKQALLEAGAVRVFDSIVK